MAVSQFEEISGNIIIRRNHMSEVGDVVDGHTHNHDHTSYFIQGKAKIEFKKQHGWIHRETGKVDTNLVVPSVIDDEEGWRKFKHTYIPNMLPIEPYEQIVEVPVGYIKGASAHICKVLIRKDVWHKITALEPHTHFHCVYSIKNPDTGEVEQDWNGNMEAFS